MGQEREVHIYQMQIEDSIDTRILKVRQARSQGMAQRRAVGSILSDTGAFSVRAGSLAGREADGGAGCRGWA
jgi:hypothetical protein